MRCDEGWISKEAFEGDVDCGAIYGCMHMSKLIKLHSLNMCSLLFFNNTSIKL